MYRENEVSENVLRLPSASSRRWWAFSVLALTVLIVVLDHMVLNVALPTLQRELGATVAALQWIVDAYVLAFATLLMTMGALGDRIGHTSMLRIGMVVFGAASLLGAFAGSVGCLVAARVFMGVGGAMLVPATLALISTIFPPEERGKAIGAWGAMNGLGVVLGPLLGGWLLEHFAWGSIFLINVPIIAVALGAGFFLIPRSEARAGRRLDLPGTLLSASTIFLLVFGIINGNEHSWDHPLVYGSLAFSCVSGLLFCFWEKRTDNPMLDFSLFKSRDLSAGCGCIAVMAFVMFGLLFALTLYMQFVKTYSPMETGLRLLPLAVGYALGSVSSHNSVLRWGTRSVVAAGFVGLTLLAPLVASWQTATPFWVVGLSVGLLSFCFGNIMTPALNAVLGAVPRERSGIGSALGNISFQLGGALGVAVLGSALCGIYRSQMAAALDANIVSSAHVLRGAKESLGVAVIMAESLPANMGEVLLSLARRSFMDGWSFIFWGACCAGIMGLLFALKNLPPSGIAITKRDAGKRR